MFAHLLRQSAQLLAGQAVGGDIDVGRLGAVPVHPEMLGRGGVGVVEMLAHRLGQHGRVVFRADDPVAPRVLLHQLRGKTDEAVATAALPVGGS